MRNVVDDRRGVSEVVGFILVFTLVMSSVALVSVVGVDTLSNARSAEQIENAERAFDVLADNLASVYGGDAPRRATEMDLATAQLHTVDNVTLNVTATGAGTVTVEREVRPVLYRAQGDTSLYYEAGAVIRTDRGGELVRRAPPLVVEDDRAVVQLVALQSGHGEGVGSSTVRVVTTAENRSIAVEDHTGAYDRVLVNVTSPRTDAWETILRDADFGSCTTGTDAGGDAFVTCERAPSGGFDRLYLVPTEISVDLQR